MSRRKPELPQARRINRNPDKQQRKREKIVLWPTSCSCWTTMNHWYIYLAFEETQSQWMNQIPNEVTDYFLQRVGFECEDVRLYVQ
jgi:hypothetical protein